WSRALHRRGDGARCHGEGEHLPGAGVRPASGQPGTEGERLPDRQEALGPPRLPDRTTGGPGADAPVDSDRPGAWWEGTVPAFARVPGHSTTAPSSKVNSRRSSSVDSSVSQPSPVPTILAASLRLS